MFILKGENMKDLSKREKFLLLTAIAVIMLYVYYAYYLLFFLNKIRDLNVIIKEIENNKDKYKYEESIKLYSDIPKSEENFKIISDIKSFSDSFNLSLLRINFNMPYEVKDIRYSSTKQMKLYAVPVEIILNGGYEDICAFIKSCEENKRICEINSAKLKKLDIGYSALLQISYYFFNNDGEVEKDNGTYYGTISSE